MAERFGAFNPERRALILPSPQGEGSSSFSERARSYRQPLQGGPDPRRDRGRLAAGAVDEDVDEMPGRRRRLVAGAEEGDLVAHARGAEPADAQAGIDGVGIGER